VTIALNLTSGIFTGYALATNGVLQALFAAGPTPNRVRAALPSLILVGIAVAARATLQSAAGWAQSRLKPQVDRLDGAELCGGQSQRIAAARAFYRTAPLLIMDEPTAALDARAEYALFSSIRTHAENRSILLITHRLASAQHADQIYVLRDGRITEQGNHDELMELRGQYAELYTLQSAQYR
jgi:ATP-binding cassette, subfamily B, bacterial